jgi:hypothetical protein
MTVSWIGSQLSSPDTPLARDAYRVLWVAAYEVINVPQSGSASGWLR